MKRNSKLRLNGVEYRVVERLSLPEHGRWKVWEPRPQPHGTHYTLIDLSDNVASQQLLAALQELTSGASGLPVLRDHGRKNGRLRLVVDWFEGITLQKYFDRVKSGRYLTIGVWEAIRLVK